MISICKHSYKKTGSTTKQDALAFVQKNAMIAFILAVLFGLGWGVGLAVSSNSSDKATFVLQLLFTIFVGCQGLLIFILHGIGKEEARNEWKKWFSTATSRTYELYNGVTKSASTAPLVNTVEDGSEDEKERETSEGLRDDFVPSKQHACSVSTPEPRVTTDAPSSESRKPRRSWLPQFKGRSSGQYDLISHESPPIRAERYKKKQSGSKLTKGLYEHEEEEEEASI